MSDLDRLAELYGVTPHYFDVFGNRKDTGEGTKRALLAAMGVACGDEAAVSASLRRAEERPWRRPLPPVHVATLGETVVVPVTLTAGSGAAPLTWRVRQEDGTEHTGSVAVADLPLLASLIVDDESREHRALTLPGDLLPAGYHRLGVEGAVAPRSGSDGTASLIVAPARGLTVDEALPDRRLWGIGLQLYSLRGRSDWGVGDFDDLGQFAELAAGLGAGLVGLNPLHALFPADPNHYGPYSPSSRQFMAVLTIDPEAVPEFAQSAEAQAIVGAERFQADLLACRAAELVDYPAVSRLKMPVLAALHRSFRALAGAQPDHPRVAAFRAFQAEMGPALHDHAVFEALHEHFLAQDGGRWMWTAWPEPCRDPRTPEVARFAAENAERVEFFSYLQWEADRQLAVAAERGRRAGLALGFYRDLAVAVNPGGASTWATPEVFVRGASVGAPPDTYNMKGQNWGLAPLSPHGLVEAAYVPFVDMVRANMRHAGALRIDHAMALKQLFWIPEDADGAYVRYPLADLLRIIALESQRNRAIVIGEDLGTVPEGFSETINAAGILSYRVLYFEREPDGRFRRPADYPADAMVTVTTHDLPSFRGFWEGHDQVWRSRLDLYPTPALHERELWERGVDRWRLLQALRLEGLCPDSYPTDDGSQPWSWELTLAAHRFLARTPNPLVMVQIEDALADREQPNLPGTTVQHPNWRRRLPVPVEELGSEPHLGAVAVALCDERPG